MYYLINYKYPLFALLGPQAELAIITSVLTLIFKRQRSSPTGDYVNPMVLAREGTSGLHRSSQPANPVPRSSTKMGIPTPQQGRVCKGLVLFKIKKDYSFPFSYFQFFLKNLWFSPGISLTASQPYKKESLKESFHGFPTKYHPFEISFCDRATSQLQPYQSCQMKQRVTQKLTSLISTCV